MATNANAVIATRSFNVFSKVFATANAFPADTVLFGTTPTGYTDAGSTSGGLNLGIDQTRNEIRVDQEFFPVVNPITEVSATLGTELAEMTPANLKLSTGLGALTSLSAISGTRGHDDWDLTSTFTDTYYTIQARVQAPDGEVFEVALWRAQPTGAVSTTFAPDNPATIAVEWTALVDTSTDPGRIMSVRDVSAALA